MNHMNCLILDKIKNQYQNIPDLKSINIDVYITRNCWCSHQADRIIVFEGPFYYTAHDHGTRTPVGLKKEIHT